MSYKEILYDVADNILTITLNRPEKLNAFTGTMMNEMIDAFQRRQQGRRHPLHHRHGRGPRLLRRRRSVGRRSDVRRDAARRPSGAQCRSCRLRSTGATSACATAADALTLEIFECLKPVIAACNGPAVGIGVTMQLRHGHPHRAARRRASASYSLVAASCRRPPRAGSCRASSASSRRSPGAIRARCSTPRKRSPAASSPEVRAAGPAAAARPRHRARDRREHRAGLCRAHPPDDVARPRHGSPDGSAQGRLRAASIRAAPRPT